MENLDKLAVEKAQQIVNTTTKKFDARDVQNLANKALGVLQEQGVYAATLFLYSRSGKDADIASDMCKPLLELAQQIAQQTLSSDKATDVFQFITEHITNDLDTLLLIKQVWEQTLIYVRYGAKARL